MPEDTPSVGSASPSPPVETEDHGLFRRFLLYILATIVQPLWEWIYYPIFVVGQSQYVTILGQKWDAFVRSLPKLLFLLVACLIAVNISNRLNATYPEEETVLVTWEKLPIFFDDVPHWILRLQKGQVNQLDSWLTPKPGEAGFDQDEFVRRAQAKSAAAAGPSAEHVLVIPQSPVVAVSGQTMTITETETQTETLAVVETKTGVATEFVTLSSTSTTTVTRVVSILPKKPLGDDVPETGNVCPGEKTIHAPLRTLGESSMGLHGYDEGNETVPPGEALGDGEARWCAKCQQRHCCVIHLL